MNSPIKVLIVEDSAVEAFYLASLLNSESYKVLTTADRADKAYEEISREIPDIILMDIMLKGEMDGIELSKKISEHYDIPVIYITALSDDQVVRRAMMTEPYGYLIKPFQGNDLVNTIEMAMYKHRIMKKLRDKEERLHSIMTNVPGAIFRCKNDPDRTVEYLSDTIETISGYPSVEFINSAVRTYASIIYPADYVNVSEAVSLSIKDKRPYEIEYRIKKADDEISWVYEKGQGVFGPDGALQWIDGGIFDISKRKLAEDNLKQAHNEISYLLASILSIVIGVSVKDRITHWNPVAESIFGISASTMIGSHFSESGIQWDWDKVFEGISSCITGDRPVHLKDVAFVNNRQEEKILGITVNPIKNEYGILFGFIIYGADVTERRIMEKQLSQAQKMETIGQLAAGIAHEINTPMQYINSNLYYIKDEFNIFAEFFQKLIQIKERILKGEAFEALGIDLDRLVNEQEIKNAMTEIPDALADSLEGVERITGIVRSIKELAHPESVEKSIADLNKIIESTIIVSRNEWKYIADLKTDLDQSIPSIACIPGEIGQALLNLIVNAAQAIEEKKNSGAAEKGLITISTKRKEGFVEICVGDSGTGIPEKIRNRIFDPFFTTKDVGKGTGQGLALTYNIIVNKHEGRIQFETELNKGTRFLILLPLEEDINYSI